MREQLPRRLSVNAQLIQILFIYYTHYSVHTAADQLHCTECSIYISDWPRLVFPGIGVNQPCVPLQHSLGDGEFYEFHQAPFISTQGAGNRGRKRGGPEDVPICPCFGAHGPSRGPAIVISKWSSKATPSSQGRQVSCSSLLGQYNSASKALALCTLLVGSESLRDFNQMIYTLRGGTLDSLGYRLGLGTTSWLRWKYYQPE